MKIKMKMKNRLHIYSKYKNCLIMTMLIRIKQLMKKVSNTEAELKKSVAYKKMRVIVTILLT